MAHLLKKDSTYEDVDFDDLLGKLTEEELEQLGQELIDPDVSDTVRSKLFIYFVVEIRHVILLSQWLDTFFLILISI